MICTKKHFIPSYAPDKYIKTIFILQVLRGKQSGQMNKKIYMDE